MTNNKQTDVKRFTKKPVTISAIQWTGDNLPDVIEFTGKHPRWGDWFADMGEYIAHVRSDGNRFKIFTLEGVMDALPGDWIIRGVQGEHYPCKPDIFAATYDPAELQELSKAEGVYCLATLYEIDGVFTKDPTAIANARGRKVQGYVELEVANGFYKGNKD